MTDIYIVTCVFKIPQTQLQLQYSREAAAREAYDVLRQGNQGGVWPIAEVTDNYGADATVDTSQLAAVMFEHVNRKLDAQREMALLNAHAQAKTQRAAAADPLLRAAVAPNGSIIGAGRQ